MSFRFLKSNAWRLLFSSFWTQLIIRKCLSWMTRWRSIGIIRLISINCRVLVYLLSFTTWEGSWSKIFSSWRIRMRTWLILNLLIVADYLKIFFSFLWLNLLNFISCISWYRLHILANKCKFYVTLSCWIEISCIF